MSPAIVIMYLTHLVAQAGSISRNTLVHLYNESLDFKNSGLKRDRVCGYERWEIGEAESGRWSKGTDS